MDAGGPLGRRSCSRRHTPSFSFTSSPNKSRRLTSSLSQISARDDEKRDRQAFSFRSHTRDNAARVNNPPGSYLTNVPSPKEGRSTSTSDQPKDDQSLCGSDPLQNGRTEDSSQSPSTGRLHGQDRSRGRIPSRPNSSNITKIFSFSMGRNSPAMAMHAIRIPRCSSDIHEAIEGDSKRSSKPGDSNGSLYGRHLSNVTNRSTMQTGSRSIIEDPDGLRVHNQHQEVHIDSQPTNGVPRSDSGLSRDDPIIIDREDESVSITSEQDANTSTAGKTNSSSATAEANRSPSISNRLCAPNTTSFQFITRGPTNSRGTFHCPTLTPSDRGFTMVGGKPTIMERKVTRGSHTGLPVRDRCIGEGMGSSLLPQQRSSNRVSGFLHTRTNQQHKGTHSGTQRDTIPMQCDEMEELRSSSTNRQSSNNELHQSDGGQGTAPSPISRTDSQLLLGQQDQNHSGIPSRDPECNSGLAVKDRVRQLRIQTSSNTLQTDRGSMGSTYDRLPSIINQHPPRQIHQLSPRSNMHVLGSVQQTDGSEGELLDVSTSIRPSHTSLSEKDSKREDKRDDGHTSLAEPTLVAFSMAPMHGLAMPPTSSSSDTKQLGGGQGGTVTPVLAISRSAAIRQQLRARKLPQAAIDLWFKRLKGGEHGPTNRNHDRIWKDYATWVAFRRCNPYDFDINHILGYVTEVIIMERKNAAGSARTFISMCSITRSVWFPNEPALTDNPTIKAIEKGIVKTRGAAVRQKPATYFSLYQVFNWLKSLTNNDRECKIDILRDKLVVLMMLDGMARASDLSTITRDAITFTDSLVQYSYYFTKEAKAPMEKATIINAYPEDRRICTVTVLKIYMERTKDYRIRRVKHMIAGTDQWRTPLFVADYKTEGKHQPIHNERISKIALRALHGSGAVEWTSHAIRGATTSKCVNLLSSTKPRVCKRARWATDETFIKSYFKECHYILAEDPRFRDMTLEQVIRYNATRVSS